jgi:hypothetical protein
VVVNDTNKHALPPLWHAFFILMTGLFMALQPKIIACGNSIAAFSMAVRFLTGPAVMAAASLAVGLKGVLFHVAIVQVYILLLIFCFVLFPFYITNIILFIHCMPSKKFFLLFFIHF